jgi:hypothetical protein
MNTKNHRKRTETASIVRAVVHTQLPQISTHKEVWKINVQPAVKGDKKGKRRRTFTKESRSEWLLLPSSCNW